MKFKEQVHFLGISKDVILGAIESISEALIDDAKSRYGNEYGFYSSMSLKGTEGIVFCEIKFFPYDYKFKWLVEEEKGGVLVTFVATTGNKWYDFLFNMGDKLQRLIDPQWSAMINFGIGFITAESYFKIKKKTPVRKHVVAAKKKITKKKKEEHIETHIDLTNYLFQYCTSLAREYK